MSETQNLRTGNKELEKVLSAPENWKNQLQEKLGLLLNLLPFLV